MKPWLQLCCAGILLISVSLTFGLYPTRHRFQQTLSLDGSVTPPVMIVSQAEWVLVFVFAGAFILGAGLVVAGLMRRRHDRA